MKYQLTPGYTNVSVGSENLKFDKKGQVDLDPAVAKDLVDSGILVKVKETSKSEDPKHSKSEDPKHSKSEDPKSKE